MVEEERPAGRPGHMVAPMQLGRRPSPVNQPPTNHAFCYRGRLRKVLASDAQPQQASSLTSARLSPAMAGGVQCNH
jgi:hypothetical protein